MNGISENLIKKYPFYADIQNFIEAVVNKDYIDLHYVDDVEEEIYVVEYTVNGVVYENEYTDYDKAIEFCENKNKENSDKIVKIWCNALVGRKNGKSRHV